jgi:hypothetical protein
MVRDARKELGSWGFKIFQKAFRFSKRVRHSVNDDGSHTFQHPHSDVEITLPPKPTSCCCQYWIAFNGIQCSHLILAHKRFLVDCWKERWWQREKLEISECTSQNDFDVLDQDDGNTFLDFSQMSTEGMTEMDATSLNLSQEIEEPSDRAPPSMSTRVALDLARELTYSIMGNPSKEDRALLLGTMVKLNEIAKGNAGDISSQSLNEALENHLARFTSTMPSQNRFSGQSAPVEMRCAAPNGSNGGPRLKSANESKVQYMRDS